jgi:hypothetical protein
VRRRIESLGLLRLLLVGRAGESNQGVLINPHPIGTVVETVRSHWDAYDANLADHLNGRGTLAVTAAQAREVVRILETAALASAEHAAVEGPWGA